MVRRLLSPGDPAGICATIAATTAATSPEFWDFFRVTAYQVVSRPRDVSRLATTVPESSRRARVVPLYTLVRTLGRKGIADQIWHNCELATRMAKRLSNIAGVIILNEVVLNQVLVQFGDLGGRKADETTHAVIACIQADGTCWAGGTVWQGKQAMRISIANWSTTEADIDRSADAILNCYRKVTKR